MQPPASRTAPGRTPSTHLLAGFLFDEGDNRFTSDHAVKNGKRYRYYVAKPEGSAPIRIPAADLELLVTSALAQKLRDASWVVHNLTDGDTPPDQLNEAVHEAAALANEVEHKLPRRQREVVHQLVSRITIQKEAIGIHLSLQSFAHSGDRSKEDESSRGEGALNEVPAKLIRRGADPGLIFPSQASGEPQINRALVKAIARAVTWYDDLVSGRAASMRDIAESEEVDDRFVVQQLHLAVLASDLVEQSVERRALVGFDITSLSRDKAGRSSEARSAEVGFARAASTCDLNGAGVLDRQPD